MNDGWHYNVSVVNRISDECIDKCIIVKFGPVMRSGVRLRCVYLNGAVCPDSKRWLGLMSLVCGRIGRGGVVECSC